jgi:ABC-2 type transport system permease protein
VFEALPVTALADGLRHVLRAGVAVPTHDWVVLAAWSVAALTAATLTFRWE